jgi:hypothetical protein
MGKNFSPQENSIASTTELPMRHTKSQKMNLKNVLELTLPTLQTSTSLYSPSKILYEHNMSL